jgi:hypothetical protein
MQPSRQHRAPSIPGQLPGHVARVIPAIQAKGAGPRETALMIELAKSFKTRQLIRDLRPGEVDQTLVTVHRYTEDDGLKVRIERAYNRLAKAEKAKKRA